MGTEPLVYRLTPAAENDLAGIWDYTVHTWSRDQADRYYGKLIRAIEMVASDERSGRKIDEIRAG